MSAAPVEYPAHWEADVVLRDGGTAHLRPIRPDDADRLRRFHSRLSAETIYFRFFSVLPELPDRDVARFTNVDYVDRAALIATVGDEMLGVVRYERTGPDEAEVAFNIEDAHQGRGLGSIFLEHIAAAARERGIARFVADVLPTNRKMLRVFADAGYVVSKEYDEDVMRLAFDLEPTEDSLAVTYAREHRAEAASVRRLLRPRSVVVVGASRSGRSLGHSVLQHLRGGGFTGAVHAVNPNADRIAGIPSYASVRDVPGPVDLAVVSVPAEQVESVVGDCAAKGVHGLVVMSSGFAETGPEGVERQQRLVSLARGSGMRVVGPGSFGVLNADPEVSLNASLAADLPERGRVGCFSQSGALGVALLDNVVRRGVVRRGLGLSTFVSAGNRADVSGNDLLQFWAQDDETDAVLLYLETVGNPRKFSRLADRLSRQKPVVVVRSGRFRGDLPPGHLVRESRAPVAAIEAFFARSGLIRADSLHEMFHIAALVTNQPLPAGRRVAVLASSDALAILGADACDAAGLTAARPPRALGHEARAEDLQVALDDVFAAEDVDAVVTLFAPPMRVTDEELAVMVARASAPSAKTTVACLLGMTEVAERLRWPDGSGGVPAYDTPEDAVHALAAVATYALWRSTSAGHPVDPPGLDVRAARRLVEELLDSRGEVTLESADLGRLLACYGIELWDERPARTADEAVAEAGQLGYPVALKARTPHLRHRRELGGVRLELADADQLARAHASMSARLGEGTAATFAVQRMAPDGVACVVGAIEDSLFGPVVSFGLGGVATELLDDLAYAVPPLTDVDLTRLVHSVRAAPLLFGHRGSPPVDVAALTDLLARVARLADDLPELAELSLNPVVVATDGLSVLAGEARLARGRGHSARETRGTRSLPGTPTMREPSRAG